MTELATKKTMPYVRLGNSGLKVSKIILGTMQYGDKNWQEWVLGEDEAIEHIKFAYDAGIQTFDTADMYSHGKAEVILGNAIKKLELPREEIVIMTKLYWPIAAEHGIPIIRIGPQSKEAGIINQYGLNRKHIFDSIKRSLKRLQLDYVDVLQCHRFDYETPIEETMHALHDVVQAGYVRYIGMSSCWAWQFHAMQNYALTNKLTPFISMQNYHSLIYREEEREMFPTTKLFGVGEQSLRGTTDGVIKAFRAPGDLEILNRVEEIAKKKGIAMAQVAIAWSLACPSVTAPIVGSTNLENLKQIIDAVHITLTEDEIKYLEEPYTPRQVFGHV